MAPQPVLRSILAYLPAAGFMAVICATSLNSSPVPELTRLFPDFALHSAGFAVLAFLLGVGGSEAFRRRLEYRDVILALGLCTAFAVSDELIQLSTPGRFCDLLDVLSDLAGSVLGLCVLRLLMAAGAWRAVRFASADGRASHPARSRMAPGRIS